MKRLFSLAKRAAEADDVRRYRIGAVGVRSDGTTVVSRNIPTKYPEPAAHAEARLARKLDKGSIVYVVRVTRAGKMTYARPCLRCLNLLKNKKVKKIFYSITEKEYGVIQ